MRYQQLVTQLKFRLTEGEGTACYYLGVEDNGHPRGLNDKDLTSSLEMLAKMATDADACVTSIRLPLGSKGRRCAAVQISRKQPMAAIEHEARVLVLGDVDTGKSTLVSVLSHGCGGEPLLDSGHGSARMRVLRHKHEIQSGRSSSLTHQVVGYDEKGVVLNYNRMHGVGPRELAPISNTMLTLLDVGGHKSVAKTTLHAMTCSSPNCCLVCISQSSMFNGLTLDQIAVAYLLNMPSCVAITKMDVMASAEDSVQNLHASYLKILHAIHTWRGLLTECHTAAPELKYLDSCTEAELAGIELASSECSPGNNFILHLSCKTGQGINIMHSFLKGLASVSNDCVPKELCCTRYGVAFRIDNVFQVSGVGPVLSGLVLHGVIRVGEILSLGPGKDAEFQRIRVTGLHRAHIEVSSAGRGQYVTIAISGLDDDGQDSVSDTMVSSPVYTPCIQVSEDSDSTSLECAISQSLSIPESSTGNTDDDDDWDLLGKSWEFSDAINKKSPLPGDTKNSNDILACYRKVGPIRKKGAFLVQSSVDPTTSTTVTAIVMLLGSGWKKNCCCTRMSPSDSEGWNSCMFGLPDEVPQKQSDQSFCSLCATNACHTLHCGAVRQVVKVTSIEQVTTDSMEESYPNFFTNNIAIAMHSAAAVLSTEDEENSQHPDDTVLTRMTLEFAHRKEFVIPGSMLILRDHITGRLTGGGIVVQ